MDMTEDSIYRRQTPNLISENNLNSRSNKNLLWMNNDHVIFDEQYN